MGGQGLGRVSRAIQGNESQGRSCGWSEGPRTLKLSAKKQSTVVGLDIEAGSVAATEVIVNGNVRVGRTGVAPLAPSVTRDGEVTDPEALGATLKELFSQAKLPRTVRVSSLATASALSFPAAERPPATRPLSSSLPASWRASTSSPRVSPTALA